MIAVLPIIKQDSPLILSKYGLVKYKKQLPIRKLLECKRNITKMTMISHFSTKIRKHVLANFSHLTPPILVGFWRCAKNGQVSWLMIIAFRTFPSFLAKRQWPSFESLPFTVAGQRRILTDFPFKRISYTFLSAPISRRNTIFQFNCIKFSLGLQ